MWNQEKVLRVAFLVGAITDALAILPMLVPPLANLLWGFEDVIIGRNMTAGNKPIGYPRKIRRGVEDGEIGSIVFHCAAIPVGGTHENTHACYDGTTAQR